MAKNRLETNEDFDIFEYIRRIRKIEARTRQLFEDVESDNVLLSHLKQYEQYFGITPVNPVWQTQICYCCKEEYSGIIDRHNFCAVCSGVYQNIPDLRRKIRASIGVS